jgi:hypothetical protein
MTAVACSTPAAADLITGEPVVVPFDASRIVIEFSGSDAGYTGSFYFLGWGTPDAIVDLTPEEDKPGLGRRLFTNKTAVVGEQYVIEGPFSFGDVLHFAYDVTHGARDTFRTDELADRAQFAWDADAGMLGIEDIRLPGGDGDHNDAMVSIAFDPAGIPAPGPLALIACAAALPLRPQRRRG